MSGHPAEAGRRLRERNGSWAHRITPVLYNETDPDAVVDLVRAFKGRRRGRFLLDNRRSTRAGCRPAAIPSLTETAPESGAAWKGRR